MPVLSTPQRLQEKSERDLDGTSGKKDTDDFQAPARHFPKGVKSENCRKGRVWDAPGLKGGFRQVLLHVGSQVAVTTKKIVAILNYKMVIGSPATKEFVEVARAEKRLRDVSEGRRESVLVLDDEVIISPIAASTLRKRVATDVSAHGRV